MKTVLIGKHATVHYLNRVFKGVIVYESRDLLYIETDKIIKIIKKKAKIIIDNKTINGKDIAKRPQDRIKK